MALDTFFGSSRSPQNTDSQRRDQAIDQMDLHEKSKEIRTMLLNISNAEEKLSIIKRKLAVISHTQSEKLMQDSKMQIFQK